MAFHHLLANRLRQLRDFNRTALVVATANESFPFQRGDVLVHRGQRGQAQRARDLFKARRVAVLVHEIDQKIQDFLLSFGERHRLSPQKTPARSSIGEYKAKRQRQSSPLLDAVITSASARRIRSSPVLHVIPVPGNPLRETLMPSADLQQLVPLLKSSTLPGESCPRSSSVIL